MKPLPGYGGGFLRIYDEGKDMTLFVNGGEITPDGKAVIEYLVAMIAEAAKDVQAMNALPGYARHYHVNVLTLEAYDQAAWLRDFNYAANVVHGEVVKLREAADPANADQGDLVKQLAEMKAEMEVVRAEMLALKEAGQKQPTKPDKSKKPDPAPADDADGDGEES